MIDISKPLIRFVSLSVQGEGRRRLPVKYEKIMFFCKHCGLLGHDHKECGDGVWEEKDLQYGAWMLAVRRSSLPVSEPRRFHARAPSRGGHAGRGGSTNPMAKKRSSHDAALDTETEEEDTASSPLKTAPMEEDLDDNELAKTRRRLILEDPNSEEGANMGNGSEASTEEVPPPPPSYTNPRDRSKQRKTTVPDTDLATSAASSEENRRAQ
jgi:hypothetical protein